MFWTGLQSRLGDTYILQTLVGHSMSLITKYFWFPYDFFSSEILKNAVVSKNKTFHFTIFFSVSLRITNGLWFAYRIQFHL